MEIVGDHYTGIPESDQMMVNKVMVAGLTVMEVPIYKN